jgi:hypothetical protein
MAIDRTLFNLWEDDDGSGESGTVLNKGRMSTDILDPIDAALATLVPLTGVAALHQRGQRATQPLASAVTVGTLYAVSDENNRIERSNGATWEPYSPAPSVGAVFPYGFSTQTADPPSSQTIRLDAAHPYTGATKLWATFQDSASEDLYWNWMRVEVGSNILIQDKDEHGRYVEVETTGPSVDRGAYVELPVHWIANGLPLAVQAAIIRVSTDSLILSKLAAIDERLTRLERP